MKIAHGTLVMATDGCKMRIFRNEGDTRRPALQLIAQERAENPKTSLQGTDRPGRAFSSASPRRSSLGDTDIHTQAKSQFALEAIKTLGAIQEKMDSDIILLAAPSVLGEIRKHFCDRVKRRIVAELDRDVVNHVPQDIVEIITTHEP